MFPFHDLIFGSIFLLITYQYRRLELIDRNQFIRRDGDTVKDIPEYDFIIVGGGSAGRVVANRLSEKFSILLLESGGNPINATYTPANFLYLNQAPEITHQFWSVPQKYEGLAKTGLKLNQDFEIFKMVQGKALGGSSTINAMVYNRGHPKDYDRWAEVTQDPSWKYENLIEYFKRTEKHELNPGGVENDQLGYSGSLNLISNADLYEDKILVNTWKEAGAELGYKEFSSANGPQFIGFGEKTDTKLNGRRFSAYDAFLAPIIKERGNLKIERYSEVYKVIFNEEGKAYGVLYKRHGINRFAKVSKEIILSAGALNSPKILLNSGIGPENDLTEAGIPVIANLPVGQKFQDHPVVVLDNFLMTQNNLPYANKTDSIFEDFEKYGKGPLSLTINNFGQAFLISSVNKADPYKSDWPDIQLFAYYNDSIYNGDNRLAVYVQISQPTSFGTLSLNKTDPLNSPLVWDPNYLSTENDVKIYREALQLATDIYSTKAFENIGVKIDKTSISRCSEYQYGSDMYWNCYMNSFITNFHPTCTCKMGKIDDPEAVVDSKLKVLGVKGLRVVDNSIQPFLTNANTNAPAMLIGQKGSQFILDEYS